MIQEITHENLEIIRENLDNAYPKRTPNTLPAKFQKYLPEAGSDLEKNISAAFQTKKELSKTQSWIYETQDWIFKGPQKNTPIVRDTHLYRLRKADKIRSYIEKNRLQNELVVPKKYLYWSESDQEFYVAAQKLSFSDNNSISEQQAKALAELAFLGYTDQSQKNLFFTTAGQVAIIDTEPVRRLRKKNLKLTLGCFSFLSNGEYFPCIQAILGIVKLKSCTTDPKTLAAIEKVQTQHVLWTIARLVAKIAALALAIYFAPVAITALVPIAALALALKVAFIALAALKITSASLSILEIAEFWQYSYRMNPNTRYIVESPRDYYDVDPIF